MTSISQHTQISSQVTSVSASTPLYSSAAKKAVSSPAIASGSSTQSPIVAVGISGSVQPNHGKSNCPLPMNGKSSISPAVPVVTAPPIAHSSSATNGAFSHGRKYSVTISANGPSSINSSSLSGSSGKIQFGSITDSPALSHSSPQIYHHNASAPVSTPNPRVCDPAHSPSPIPQPSASGGRPPVVGPSNGVNFGSFGGDGDRHIWQAASPQPQLAPGVQQPCHNRRDSSQSGHSDMSGHQTRGGFPPANRGRGGFQGQYQSQQMGGYAPQNNSYRNSQSQGRGGMPPYQSQGRPPFPNSPHQTSRSPALPTSSIPGTPNMNQSIPMPTQQLPPFFPQHMTGPQFNYHPHPPYDPRGIPIPNSVAVYPQITYVQGATHPPQAGYQQPHYTPAQYVPQAQQMSRNSSQMSEHRPASSMGQPQGPLIPSVMHPLTPQSKPNTTFSRRPRKNAAIAIKRPDGETLDMESFKSPSSPAPNVRARTPPVVASVPTSLPKSATSPLFRTERAASKTSDQIKQEMIEKVKKAAAEDNETVSEAPEVGETEKLVQEEQKPVKASRPENESNIKVIPDVTTAPPAAQIDEKKDSLSENEVKETGNIQIEPKEKETSEKMDTENTDATRLIETSNPSIKVEEATKSADLPPMNQQPIEISEKMPDAKSNVSDEEKHEAESESPKTEPKSEQKTQLSTGTSPLKISTPANVTSVPSIGESMKPPQKYSLAAEKRSNKPSSLNLMPLDGKSIEAPQPSAALMSLKSARYLTVLDPSIYPPTIMSPNPALNQAVMDKGRSFKYDKEFLLQFQKVFVEKPSLEFESQIKALIGDAEAGSTRFGSARATDSMSQRNNSNNRNINSFSMGNFKSTGGKTLPSGTTSEQRFSMSSSSLQRPQASSIPSFNRSHVTGFPTANTMARNPSNSSMPHSPRQQSRRANASNKGYNSSNSKQDSQAAKTMPLTAGMDLKPIQISATGWKPRSVGNASTGTSGPVPGASAVSGHMEPDMVQRKVKAALNKMTPEKFDKISDQILTIAAQSKDEADGRTLRQVIQLTFEKATDEAHWASMYAKFCKRMLETMSPEIKDETILDKFGNVVSGGSLFRKYLLNRCQVEFERGWKMDLPEKPEGERGEEKTEEAVMLSDEYYIAAAAKRRGLGLVQFIGELYKLGMLTERIMHECVKKLVDYTGIPDEAEIESLTKLLKTIGFNLDGNKNGKLIMDAYFVRIQSMINTPELPSRLRFMLMDIVDLRKKDWASKESNKGPKTLEEVRAEAEAAAAQKAAESARSSQRGGTGGGGRSHLGRNDGRNFSNQHGMQPPPDYQKNMVGVDDLRRLAKNSNSRPISQQMSFGPTSMFSRSSSGRKMGPGGSIGRAGEDSGLSSRTGTPPQQREKESATSANAFSLLAGLGSGENENPASPPSASVSPALSKATPATGEKSDQ
ncbi:Eukaryotic translation initiation factor 4 gamma [Podosphaera aphanis]|nr:Eukaryotic translation initiation factor 4 gamma [Podosphaera aphanis]